MTIFRNCEGTTRRNWLQLGLGGLVGAGLAPLLRGRALADVGIDRQQQADACILVWLDGGPTHYETFDPKPEAPVEIRGEFGTTPTAVPELTSQSIW